MKDLQLLKLKVDEELLAASFSNEEYLLDVPFSAAEVMTAVRRLKRNKAAGPDGLLAEHFKFAGEHVIIWLRNIMNGIIELEAIPDFMKMGLVVPVYKGGGKDPMKMDSYRGITINCAYNIKGFRISNTWQATGFPSNGWNTTHQSDGLQEENIVC